MPQLFSHNLGSFNTTEINFNVADDRSDILSWLSPLDPRSRHQDIRDRRVENVGDWLLETDEFRNWYAGSGGDESDNAVLFCYGDPGAGKTYISSLVIDSLCDQARGQNIAVACFYFDFAARKEQSSANTLGALLKQIVSGLEEIPADITRDYETQKKVIGGRGPLLSDIVKMLQTTSSEKRTFICVDALDECADGDRIKLLGSLNKILQRSPSTRIFVTGRPHIRAEIGKRLSGRVAAIHIAPRRGDVVSYLHTRLDEDTIPDAMDSSLEADILRKIPEDISEIFLLVSLNIDAILQETTIHRRRQKLCSMTDGLGLGDAYGATLDRIKGQGGEKARLGMAALMWISHSERPLKTDELCHALGVEIGSANLNINNVPSAGTLLTCCQGLVIVDREVSTVRLIHFTLQEHLRAHPELFGAAHSTLAETCLSYLNSKQVKSFSTRPSLNFLDTPFLEYSSLYWGTHAKRDLSNCAKLLALKLFGDYKNHISAKILLRAEERYHYSANFNRLSEFTGLHCASTFGIVELVAGLIEVEGFDINQKDCVGNTPLMWASRNGHEEVVKMLLERDDVNPEELDRYGQTPLCCAAWSGHERVVEILLGRGDANPDDPDYLGRTPLCCAAWCGHEEALKMLLRRGDANPDNPDFLGRTPLWCAAQNGHEGVVKILLGRDDVRPDKPGTSGRTPLCCAAESGHEGVVKILLERDDVNPEAPDRYGQTPLCCAAWAGRDGVVKMLLERDDINPDRPDRRGRTPLWWAARMGHEGIVKILLERDDVNPNKPDKRGRTPLWPASQSHDAGVVALLQPGSIGMT